MNSVNYGLVALALTLLFVNPHAHNTLWAVATALALSVLIDVDHHLNRGPTALTLARLLSAPTLAWLACAVPLCLPPTGSWRGRSQVFPALTI